MLDGVAQGNRAAKVIELVGRSPRLYPRGILEALDRHKNSLAPAPITQSVPPNAAAVVSHNAAKPACQPEIRTKSDADQMRQAHERRLAVLRAHPPESPAEPATAEKAGTRPGTRAETIRRRYEVAQLLHLGLSVRTISLATGIPPTSVHRAKRAIARAEAKQELAVLEIMDELIGKAARRQAKVR
jgi:flavin-binding protein dodecin